MAKLKIKQTNSVSGTAVDSFISPTLINGNHYGGVGGDTSQSGLQIKPNVYVVGSGVTTAGVAGNIVAQKGAHKYLVTDAAGNKGTCTLTNSTTLTGGQMNLWANICIIPSAVLAAANTAGGATSTTVSWSTTPIGPVATPRVGDYIVGFVSANIGAWGAQVSAVNSDTNVTVTITGNVAAQTVLANTMTLVSRIDNKFIHDFISDGVQDSTGGTVNYYSNGYNPTKFRYVLGGNAVSSSSTVPGGFARVISL